MSDCRFGVSPVNYSDPDPDASALIFLLDMHSLMLKVWCKFEQNRTKAIKVPEQNP